jgi:hypothetical protein
VIHSQGGETLLDSPGSTAVLVDSVCPVPEALAVNQQNHQLAYNNMPNGCPNMNVNKKYEKKQPTYISTCKI